MRIVDQLLGHSPSSRRKKILHGIDIRNLSGLEIGALDKPIVRRPPCRVKRALLRPAGILSLVIPDRRFTFDILRPATSFGEMLEAYYTKRAKPCFADVFDQCYYWRTISAKRIAARIQNPRKMTAPSPPAENLKLALQSLEPARHEDVHSFLRGRNFSSSSRACGS